MAENDAPTTIDRVKERRERLGDAADALERAITGPAGEPDSWGDGVRAAAAEVRAALDAHVVEVESPGGLYVEITDRSPRLAHAIEVLRREHGTMGQQLDELDAVLDSRAPDVEKVREDALVLLMEISRHRHKGADLIWESFNFDIGSGE